MPWCGACQDNFDVGHYDEHGVHLRGEEYGPVGAGMALRDQLASALRLIQWGEMGSCCVCDGFLDRRPHADDCPVGMALRAYDKPKGI